jgi:hypothetical protein
MQLGILSTTLELFDDLPIGIMSGQATSPKIVVRPRNRLHYDKPVQLDLKLDYIEACINYINAAEDIPDPVISVAVAEACDAMIDMMQEVKWTHWGIICLHQDLMMRSLEDTLASSKKVRAEALAWIFGDDHPSIPFSFFNCCRILTSVYGQYVDHEFIRAKVLYYLKSKVIKAV